MDNSDIIEIKIFDNTHQILFRGEARLKMHTDTKKLCEDLKMKGVDIRIGKKDIDWFG